jgi:hypothetical protein
MLSTYNHHPEKSSSSTVSLTARSTLSPADSFTLFTRLCLIELGPLLKPTSLWTHQFDCGAKAEGGNWAHVWRTSNCLGVYICKRSRLSHNDFPLQKRFCGAVPTTDAWGLPSNLLSVAFARNSITGAQEISRVCPNYQVGFLSRNFL